MSEDTRRTFDKPVLGLEQQLNLLISRGLIVDDREKALHYLQFIGYFRLSGYTLPFQNPGSAQSPHRFHDNIRFDDVLNLYIFDRELRLLVMDAIERIEVAIRTAISNTMSERYGAHWYMVRSLFRPGYAHGKLLNEIKAQTKHTAKSGTFQHKKRETFIQHYFSTYRTPALPPSWMIAEVLSIGTWSTIYSNLNERRDKKAICEPYPLSPQTMHSWLHVIAYLRNLCAHHSRLWNRRFTISPEVPKAYKQQMASNKTFYAQAVMLHLFMDTISSESCWQNRLQELFAKYPKIPHGKMGFPDGWHKDSFWVR